MKLDKNLRGSPFGLIENPNGRNGEEYAIRELEVSITSKCHLRCDNCGFYVPRQPDPAQGGDAVREIVSGLSHLRRLNITIGSLGILGGDPTYAPKKLEAALEAFSMFDNIGQIEVVSHGLMPQNISKSALKRINKLSISAYFDNEDLISLWKIYLDKFAPNVKFSVRVDKEWDQWMGRHVADDDKAQNMFDHCWYRKHCATIERNTLFLCSRIAKLRRDGEGIALNERTSLDDVRNYLNRKLFTASCKTCTPMMGFPKIKAGQQPDGRIAKMAPRAVNFLSAEINSHLKRIGLYGVSGTGKTTVIKKVIKLMPNLVWLEGAKLVADAAGLTLDEFKNLSDEEKYFFREKAIDKAFEIQSKENKHMIIDAHFAFAEGGGAFKNVVTEKDVSFYTDCVYLKLPPETVLAQQRNDKTRQRNYSLETISNWIEFELRGLKRLCADRGLRLHIVDAESSDECADFICNHLGV